MSESAKLLAVPVLLLVAWIVGTALAPLLLVESPLALVALSPEGRHLFMVAPVVDPFAFMLVVTLRLLAADPFLFLFGKRYGDAGVQWLERLNGGAGRFARWLEAAFGRWWVPFVFLSSGPIICVLAGAARLRFGAFMLVNVLGSLAVAGVYLGLGERLASWTEAIREFVSTEVVVLTVVSVLAMVGWLAYRWSRRAEGQDLE